MKTIPLPVRVCLLRIRIRCRITIQAEPMEFLSWHKVCPVVAQYTGFIRLLKIFS